MAELLVGQVALFIDFENLVRGVADPDAIDCEVLFRLSEEYGRVLLANAYADWRMKDVNQYQTDLYRLGVELVHVFGKGFGVGFKNAVDVKMAVDAILAISAMPHVDTYVIVSGDRDFIHVLKALRRQGKMVIGVSPSRAASDDFAALCDRFVRFEAISATYDQQEMPSGEDMAGPGIPSLGEVRQAIASMLRDNPAGIKGAAIKPALRRSLSPSFDESAYGFPRLMDLLYSMNDVANVVVPQGGGDILVLPASSKTAQPTSVNPPSERTEELIQRAKLKFYRYQRDPECRRRLLTQLYDELALRETFRWGDVEATLIPATADSDAPLSPTFLNRYRSMLMQMRVFVFVDEQIDVPQRERLARLNPDIRSAEALVKLYEANVAYKVKSAAGPERPLTVAELARVLGLDETSAEVLEYCQDLVDRSSGVAPEGNDPD